MFPYEQAQYEYVPCNLCGAASNFKVIATRDRYGLLTQTCLCRGCGLIFINPRMTKGWYAKFYETAYRKAIAEHKKKNPVLDLDKLFAIQERTGVALGEFMGQWFHDGLTIEVGSGVGGVLGGIKKVRPAIEPVGIEPSPKEAVYANTHGVKTYASLFEDFHEALPPAANVLSSQNLNHLLDPKAFLLWAHKQLRSDGRLILVVQNFRSSASEVGRVLAQIDHVYMFTPETLLALVRSAGFEPVFFDNPEERGFGGVAVMKKRGLSAHMRLVAQKRVEVDSFATRSKLRYYRVAFSMSRPVLMFQYYGRYKLYRLSLILRSRTS